MSAADVPVGAAVRWTSVHGGSVWHRLNPEGLMLCQPERGRSGTIPLLAPNDPSPEARCVSCENVHQKNLQRAAVGRAPADPKSRREETDMTGTPTDRLSAIIAQRLRVRKAQESLEQTAAAFGKAKADQKAAEEKHAEEERILLEIIDDKPAGPLYEGKGAGTGRIPPPQGDEDDDQGDGGPDHPGDVDEAHAAAQTNKRARGRKKN